MTLERSACGQFVRVTIDGKVAVLTIGDVSRLLSTPGEFVAAPNRTYL